jgi:hypothetical protein
MSDIPQKPRDPLNPPPRRRPAHAAAPVTQPVTPPQLSSGVAEPVAVSPGSMCGRTAKRQPTGDYLVGNCRPPVSGQIKQGEVRNPRGRPRGAIGFNTIVKKTMTAKVTVRTASGEQRMTRLEASFIKLADKAFSGDVRAMQSLFTAYVRAVPEQPTEDHAAEQASLAEDEAILAEYREMLRHGEAVPAAPVSHDDLVTGEDDDDA